MLIALITDVHANIYGLEAVLKAIRTIGVDMILCAGDIVGYYPWVNETIDLLKAEDVVCIAGNHDAILRGHLTADEERWCQYQLHYTSKVIHECNLEWIRRLPVTQKIEVESMVIQVVHGSPWKPLTEYIYPDHKNFSRFAELSIDYLILGHTHWSLFRQVDGVTIINPGSCGQPRDYIPGGAFALLDTEKRKVTFHRIVYDMHRLTNHLRDLNWPTKLINIFYRTR